MPNRLCIFLFLVSMSILASATDQDVSSISKEDEMHRLSDELYRHSEIHPHMDKYLRQIVNLVSYQSERITSQAAEIADLRREQVSVTQSIKEQSESIQSQDKTIRAQNEEILALKKEVNTKVDDMIALKSEMEVLTKRTKALEREQKMQMQTILSQARQIQYLRRLQTERAVQTHKEDQADEVKKEESRRIVLHSDVDILHLVTTHSADIKNLQNNMTTNNADIKKLQNNMTTNSGEIQSIQNEVATMKRGLATKASGSTYVRWGRKSCPSVNGTEFVYSGFTGGSLYSDTGAASNYLCLSSNPLWGRYTDTHDSGAHVYGTEYELSGGAGGSRQVFGTNMEDEDAPCSVCRSSRPTVIMIPGRNQCYPGWTLEYKGYLVAGGYGHAAASEFVCLDDQPEVLQSGHADRDGKLFYFAEGRCGSLPCLPYVDGRELTCVVCTK